MLRLSHIKQSQFINRFIRERLHQASSAISRINQRINRLNKYNRQNDLRQQTHSNRFEEKFIRLFKTSSRLHHFRHNQQKIIQSTRRIIQNIKKN